MDNNKQPEKIPAPPQENVEKNEQMLEEIIAIVAEAIASGKEVKITQRLSDGSEIKNSARPIEIGDGFVMIEADGFCLYIDLKKVSKVSFLDSEATR